NLNNTSLVDTSIGITSFAAGAAGSAGSGVSVAGSSSVNVVLMDTTASVGANSTVSGTAGVEGKAEDLVTVFSAAGSLAASAGSTGVGVGLDVNVITRHTLAHVDQGTHVTSSAGNIDVAAISKDDITSIAATFGLSGGNAGVAASIGVTVLTTETRA